MESIRELERVLTLKQLGPTTFEGPAMNALVFVRMFGGHLAAQALAAASATIGEDKYVHSLHSYFLRPADADLPVRYEVLPLRDGRSYALRTVQAYQGEKLCFVLSASFHHSLDEGPEHAEKMPDVPCPETIAPGGKIPSGVPDAEKEFHEWDIRDVPLEDNAQDATTVSGRSLWFRYRHPLPDTDVFHAQALTYLTDMTLLYTSLQAHPEAKVQLASLDRNMWFLRPVRVDDWLLYRQSSPSAGSGRALTQGKIFDSAGNLVALIVQEGLARNLREGATQVPMRGN